MGEPRLSGADRSEMRQAEKIKSAGRRKRRKKKKTIPTCIKFFFSLSCPEGGGYRDSGLPLQCFLPLLLISFFSLDLSSERRTFLASHKWEKEESSLAQDSHVFYFFLRDSPPCRRCEIFYQFMHGNTSIYTTLHRERVRVYIQEGAICIYKSIMFKKSL